MGWQPDHANNTLAYLFGFIGAGYQAYMNMNIPVGFWSKFLESVLTAGVCGFVGMAGKWVFEIAKKYLMEYFRNRKNKAP